MGAGDEPRAPRMPKRGRNEVDWEKDVELAVFCAENVRFVGDASRPELRSFWSACSWLEGEPDEELEQAALAEAVKNQAYALWLEDKEHTLGKADFIPADGKRPGGKTPTTAKRGTEQPVSDDRSRLPAVRIPKYRVPG